MRVWLTAKKQNIPKGYGIQLGYIFSGEGQLEYNGGVRGIARKI